MRPPCSSGHELAYLLRGLMADYYYCVSCLSRLVSRVSNCTHCQTPAGAGPRSPLAVSFGPVAERTGQVPVRISGVFGEYVLLELLGAGGMGSVFHALAPRSGQHFAIKVINDELLRRKRSIIQRFRAEADVQSRIVHPNAVRLFQLIEFQGRPGLVLEYIRGASMDVVMGNQGGRPFDVGQIIWLGKQMAAGLSVVHEYGYLHSDVKPSNFLLGANESGVTTLKIADFGIATSLRDELSSSRAGTPGYMSPEQIAGRGLSVKSDLYSLGCVLFEFIALQPVFQADSQQELDHLHQEVPAPPVGSWCPEIPDELGRMIDALVAKKPEARPDSADQVFHAFARYD